MDWISSVRFKVTSFPNARFSPPFLPGRKSGKQVHFIRKETQKIVPMIYGYDFRSLKPRQRCASGTSPPRLAAQLRLRYWAGVQPNSLRKTLPK